MTTLAQKIAAARAKIAYWAARTGGIARRWLKYWSDKLSILIASSKSGIPPGTPGAPPTPDPDVLAPAAPVGISATGDGAGTITVVCDPTGDLANGDAVTPSGIASYTLNVDGADQSALTVGSLGASANVQSAESYVDIGTITSGSTPTQNGRQVTATNSGTGIDSTSDNIRVFRPVQETGSFKRRVKLTQFYGSASASIYSYFGLIVRDTASASLAASPGAKYFAIYQWLTNAAQGLETAIRATTSAAKTYRNQVDGGSNARWVQISGSYSGGTWTFIASYSTDGGAWTVLDTYSIGTWGSTVTVGRFIGNESTDYALTGVCDDDVHLSGSQAAISTTYASSTNVALKWKATDVAGNVSPYSKIVNAAGGVAAPPTVLKKNFGHYPWVSPSGEAIKLEQTAVMNQLKSVLDTISTHSNVKGIRVLCGWSTMESDGGGNYSTGIAAWQTLLDYAYSKGKSIIMVPQLKDWGYVHAFPTYLNADLFLHYGAYQEVAIWRSTPTTGFTNMMNAYGALFDQHPALEMVEVGMESSTNFTVSVPAPSGYSNDTLVTSIVDYGIIIRQAFPSCGVRVNINWGGADSVIDTQYGRCVTNALVASVPDYLPSDIRQGDRVFQGKNDSGSSVYTSRLASLGYMACMEAPGIQSSFTLAQVLSAITSGYNPADTSTGNFHMAAMPALYTSWLWNTYIGDSSKQYTAQLAFYDANPLPSVTLPTSYSDYEP